MLPPELACARLQGSALKVAAHFVVPVNECAIWIVLPCPDVQFVKSVEAVSVWAGNQLQQLLIELRRSRIFLCPGGCVHNELDANQAHGSSPQRLINQGLR